MKKYISILICCVFAITCFGLCLVSVSASGYTISFNAEGISIPKVSGSDFYILSTRVDGGSWVETYEFNTSDFGGLDTYTYRFNTTYNCDFKVVVYDVEGGELSATSNILSYTIAPFFAEAYELNGGNNIVWDSVDMATAYRIYYLDSIGTSHLVASKNSLEVMYHLEPTDVPFVNYYVVAITPRGSLRSNNVYVSWVSDPVFFPWDTSAISLPVFPGEQTAVPYPGLSDINIVNHAIFYGFLHSDAGSYLMLALTMLTSFAILSYFVFRLH